MTIAQRVVGPVIPSDTNTVDLTMTGQTLTANVKASSIKPEHLDSTVFAGSGTAGTASHSDHTHTSSAITNFAAAVSANSDVSANTAARHTHSNKTTLDATTASFTTAKDSKLSGIAAGAEVNVQSDWNAGSGDAFILNKPTLGTIAAHAEADYVGAGFGYALTQNVANLDTTSTTTNTALGPFNVSYPWSGTYIVMLSLSGVVSRSVGTGRIYVVLGSDISGFVAADTLVSYTATADSLHVSLTASHMVTNPTTFASFNVTPTIRGDVTAGTTYWRFGKLSVSIIRVA